ncbi:CotO family spore coat protein [Gracilibacillus oryzae]|nr:CotO family spore coat protein [Gracilibacillus oryzae]
MSSTRKSKQSPKLYLHQPTLSEPASKMQTIFQTNKKTKRKEAPKQKETVSEGSSNKKKFKEMTILEKVEHFAAMPMHLPRVRCEIITERKKYYGFIQRYQNDMVSIRTASKAEEVSVPLKQIQAINIAGF